MSAIEPILVGPKRLGSHEVAYPFVQDFERLQASVLWNAHEIDLTNDAVSFRNLPKEQQELVKKLLGFFVVGDDVVGSHLSETITPHASRFEVRNFVAIQEYIERVHMQAYDRLISNTIDNPEEIERLRDAITNLPSVAKLIEWVTPFSPQSTSTIQERVLAFVCFEGIVFSAAFAIIYWFRAQRACPGLCKANEWIARDEGIHTQLWAAVFKQFAHKPSEEQIQQIIKSAVDATCQFAHDILPTPIGILSGNTMSQYIKVVANGVYGLVGGNTTLYPGATNPYQFMVNINLLNNTDLFGAPVTDYKGVGGLDADPSFDSVFG